MSEHEKDQWILNQATVLSPAKRLDFMKTLTHDKIVMSIPDDKEFYQWCDDIRNGKLYIGYETWYQEFDEFGYYYDDWETKFYDTCHVIDFIDYIFEACQNLNKLGYYGKTYEYMLALTQLEIEIRETEDSEDSYYDTEPFTINTAYQYFLPIHQKKEVAYNWIWAYCQNNQLKSIENVIELLNIFCNPLCDKVLPSDFNCLENETYKIMKSQLQESLKKHHSIFNKKYANEKYYTQEQYDLENIMDREQQVLDDLRKIS